VRAIRQPDADGVDVLAGGNRRGVTDQRDQLPSAARLHLEDGETRVRVMEGDPLDAADQRFAIGPEAVVRVAANGRLLPGKAQKRCRGRFSVAFAIIHQVPTFVTPH
jgi:hypothetical protein